MKFQTLMHWKFRKLHKALGSESIAHTAGYLELLWLHCQQVGNGPILRADDVEAICDWPGEPRKLLRCLRDLTWLDDCADGNLVEVHDFADHAPGYVKKREQSAAYMRKYRKDKKEDGKEEQPPLASVNERKHLRTSVNDPTLPNLTLPNLTVSKETVVCLENDASHITAKQVQAVIDYWNGMTRLPTARGVTAKRDKAIRAILKDAATRDCWRDSIDAVTTSEFHLGKNERGWKITFDWWARIDKVLYFAERGPSERVDKHGHAVTIETDVDELGF